MAGSSPRENSKLSFWGLRGLQKNFQAARLSKVFLPAGACPGKVALRPDFASVPGGRLLPLLPLSVVISLPGLGSAGCCPFFCFFLPCGVITVSDVCLPSPLQLTARVLLTCLLPPSARLALRSRSAPGELGGSGARCSSGRTGFQVPGLAGLPPHPSPGPAAPGLRPAVASLLLRLPRLAPRSRAAGGLPPALLRGAAASSLCPERTSNDILLTCVESDRVGP